MLADDLGGQRVHVVAEHGARVGVGVEVVVARILAQLGAHRAQQVVAVGLERVLLRPDLAHDLQARVAAAGMDAEQAPARPERAHQRRDHALRLEFAGTRAR